jgi:hypothetical protein
MRTRKWSRVPGTVSVEMWWIPPRPGKGFWGIVELYFWPILYWFRSKQLLLGKLVANDYLPGLLAYRKQIEDGDELVIEFESSGYYDPGKTYGPPENCYPPEGDDEREVTDVYIFSDGHRYAIDQSLWEDIEELFRDQIEEAEIDTYDY